MSAVGGRLSGGPPQLRATCSRLGAGSARLPEGLHAWAEPPESVHPPRNNWLRDSKQFLFARFGRCCNIVFEGRIAFC